MRALAGVGGRDDGVVMAAGVRMGRGPAGWTGAPPEIAVVMMLTAAAVMAAPATTMATPVLKRISSRRP